MNFFEIENSFKAFLTNNNHPINGSIKFDSNQFIQFACPHSNKRNRNARYRVYSDGIPAGYLHCWRCDIKQTWCFKNQHEVTKLDWIKHKRIMFERKKAEEIQEHQRQLEATKSLKKLWADSKPCLSHRYFDLKQVQVFESDGFRIADNRTLLLPIRLISGELISIQRVYWNKQENKFEKRFFTGLSPKNGMHILGEIEAHDSIYFAEGIATCLSIRDAVKSPVICVYGKNFHVIAPIVAKAYPGKKLIYCCDLPSESEIKLKVPTSEDYARKAMVLVGGTCVLPDFNAIGINEEERLQKNLTDFNDLFVSIRKGNSACSKTK